MSRRRSAALRTRGDDDFDFSPADDALAAEEAASAGATEGSVGARSGLRELQNADRQAHAGGDPLLLDTVSDLIWRGTEFGRPVAAALPTGFSALDAELPGAGWPVSSVTEVLQAQFCQAEWRLLLPALAPRATAKVPLLAIAPPHAPFFGGLRRYGLDDEALVVIHAKSPSERLWATEQAVKANGLAGVIAWLANARGDQVRRLQTCAAQCGFPVFLVRPETAKHESSAAPLRLQVRLQGMDTVGVHILKRKGPAHVGWLPLAAAPPGLAPLLPSAEPSVVPALLSGMRPAADAAVRPRPQDHSSRSLPAQGTTFSPDPSHVFADATVDGAPAARATAR